MRAIVAAVLALIALPLAAGAQRSWASEARFVRNAISSFDDHLVRPNADERRFMRRRYFQMRGYSPFFERNAMRWRPPPTSFAQDLYAIYNPSENGLVNAHPDWVLRDLLGLPLFIPDGCTGAGCPQYAADVGNQGWRNRWIAEARATFARAQRRDPRRRGYIGVYIDDVNLELQVSNASGKETVPIDPRTGLAMSLQAWRGYVASFLEQIRAAFPKAQITHNSLWWLPHDDPAVIRQLAATDWVELERGFNDAGIAPGGGAFGYETFLAHIDWLHQLGKRVILQPYLASAADARYELANYFLIRRGADAINSSYRSDPPTGDPEHDWWRGWRTNPGRPLGRRRRTAGGLWKREFSRGIAIVNPPGGNPVTVRFRALHTNSSGATASSFELEPQSGDVFVRGTRRR